MNLKRWSNAPARLATAVVVVLTLFCLASMGISIYYGGLGSDAAAWAQAGGSIAAIAGAAWLFGADTRRQRRSRRLERVELAWGVRFALVQAKFECNGIAWEFVGPEAKPAPSDLRHWRLRTGVSKSLLQSYAARTDHVHPALVHLAYNGLFLLEQMEEDLDAACARMVTDELPGELVNGITWYVSHLDEVIKALDERMRGIVQALDEGDDMMPAHHHEDWKVSPEVAKAVKAEEMAKHGKA